MPQMAKTRLHFFDGSLDDVLQKEEAQGHMFTGTKVIATIGPACQDVATLTEMLTAGAVGARVDLTWGPLDFHRKSLSNLQAAMQGARRLCCTIVDTLGREVMVRRKVHLDENGWPVHDGEFDIKAGQTVTLTTRLDVATSASVLPLTYDKFNEMAQKGDTIYVGRYLVSGADTASLYLEVQDVVGEDVICLAKNDALLTGLLTCFHVERSQDSLANVQNAQPLLSDYDKEAFQILAREHEIDFLSLSYVRTAEDVKEARAYLASIGSPSTRILAKVETRQALLNLSSILAAADGIIMSRGNLGLDCAPEKMALIQKTLIQACNLVGKPVFITRVVDTMVDTPRPTRAEATDVANAVLDGADGVLLGAETLRGKYAVDCVTTVCRIARSAEAVFNHSDHFDFLMETALYNEDEVAAQQFEAIAPQAGRLRHSTLHEGEEEEGGEGDSAGGSSGALLGRPMRPSASGAELDGPSLGGAVLRTSGNGLHRSRLGHLQPSMAHNGSSSMLMGLGSLAGSKTRLMSASTVDMLYSSSSNLAGMPGVGMHVPHQGAWRSPLLSKLEAIASSAVRAAEKVGARLIMVYTHTGMSAALVAKYKPPVPVLSLVVPTLRSNGLRWTLEGRGFARQSLLNRGVLPMLVSPSAQGEEILEEAAVMASHMGLCSPQDQVVCVQRVHGEFCVKIVKVMEIGYMPHHRLLVAPPACGSAGNLPVLSVPQCSPSGTPFVRGVNASPSIGPSLARQSLSPLYEKLEQAPQAFVSVASMRLSSGMYVSEA